MSLKDICALIVVLIMALFAFRYGYQIRRREIKPRLATWIVFLVGVSLTLGFYVLEEDWDLISGVNNAVDLLVVIANIVCVLVWADPTVRFRPWEKYYFLAAGFIVLYGALSGDLLSSNLFGQILICLGYLPMWWEMVETGKNSESFTAWGLGLAAPVVGLVPSLVDGNVLSAVYVIRTIIMCATTLVIMTYFELRARRRSEAG